jgi:hypothetical protein
MDLQKKISIEIIEIINFKENIYQKIKREQKIRKKINNSKQILLICKEKHKKKLFLQNISKNILKFKVN